MRQFFTILFSLLFFMVAKSQVSTMTYIYNKKTWTIEYRDTVTSNRLIIISGLPTFVDGSGNQIDTTKVMSCEIEFNYGGDLVTNVSTSLAKGKNIFMLADNSKATRILFTNIKIAGIKIADFYIQR